MSHNYNHEITQQLNCLHCMYLVLRDCAVSVLLHVCHEWL